MPPHAHVVHGISRRLRLKFPEKRNDQSFFSHLQEKLVEYPGVERVEVNPRTAGALILYDCDVESIVRYAAEHDLFVLRRLKPVRRTVFGTVTDIFRSYDRELKRWTGGELDVASLVFLSLVVSGAFQVLRGNITAPAWYTAFYLALGVFHQGRVDEYDEGDSVDPVMDGGESTGIN